MIRTRIVGICFDVVCQNKDQHAYLRLDNNSEVSLIGLLVCESTVFHNGLDGWYNMAIMYSTNVYVTFLFIDGSSQIKVHHLANVIHHLEREMW